MTSGRVLITGATGFLGSEIVRQAVEAGLPVTATGRAERKKPFDIDFVPADILDPLSLSEIFEGVYCVCHAAGLVHVFDKGEALKVPFHAVNVIGSENVVRAAIRKRVPHFIFISSVSVYGSGAHGKHEDSECRPEGHYAESKLQAEKRLIEICQEAGINLTILRLATLYGEEDVGNIYRLIRFIERGRFIWVGKGENFKSLLHREDAARACLKVIKAPVSGINIYNVSASPCKMSEIVEAITGALGKVVPSWRIPASFVLNSAKVIKYLSFNNGKLRTIYSTLQKWLADDYYNTDKFYKTFNFQTKINYKEGIKREVAWFKGFPLMRG